MSRPITRPGFGAASGFTNLEGVLNTPMVHGEFLSDLRCEVIFDRIFTTKYYKDLTCGTTVMIPYTEDPKWEDLIPNQDLEIQQLDVCKRPLHIGYAKYTFVKLDDMAADHICHYKKLEADWKKKALKSAKQIVERTVFDTLYYEASIFNQGSEAGVQTRQYNLGKVGAPFPLNGITFITLLLYMDAVLGEQCVPESDRFVIFPHQAKLAFMSSKLVDVQSMGSCVKCSPLKTGKWYSDIMGFDVYLSHYIRACKDPITGKLTYIVLFGHKDALSYTWTMHPFEYVRFERAFGGGVRIRMTWGAGASRPEGLGYAYVEIDNLNPIP